MLQEESARLPGFGRYYMSKPDHIPKEINLLMELLQVLIKQG